MITSNSSSYEIMEMKHLEAMRMERKHKELKQETRHFYVVLTIIINILLSIIAAI